MALSHRTQRLACAVVALAAARSAAPEPAPQPDDSRRVVNGIGMELVLVPAGDFAMGTSGAKLKAVHQMRPRWQSERLGHEAPEHRVRITRPFYIARFETTNAEYRRFKPKHDSGSFLGRSLNADRQPAVNLSWADAVAFCAWLSEREGRVYSLPTAAEWEFACRGGTSTLFHWGDRFDAAKANHADQSAHYEWSRAMAPDGHAVSAAVGSYPANPLGLHDMLGNVWEWCADWYDASYYQRSPAADPPGGDRGVVRVCRGGGWDAYPSDCRPAKRAYYFPGDKHMALGFRVAMRPGTGAKGK